MPALRWALSSFRRFELNDMRERDRAYLGKCTTLRIT